MYPGTMSPKNRSSAQDRMLVTAASAVAACTFSVGVLLVWLTVSDMALLRVVAADVVLRFGDGCVGLLDAPPRVSAPAGAGGAELHVVAVVGFDPGESVRLVAGEGRDEGHEVRPVRTPHSQR